jgi:hypothetical protein
VGNVYKRLRGLYGEHPLHLLAYGASFALAGYAALILVSHQTIRVVVWFAGAAVAHDLLILPLYALANVGLTWVWSRRPQVASVPWLNYVRFPSAISAVLFLVYLPEITRQRTAQLRDSGLSNHAYLDHWLFITGLLFAASAIIYVIRIWQVVRRNHAAVLSMS